MKKRLPKQSETPKSIAEAASETLKMSRDFYERPTTVVINGAASAAGVTQEKMIGEHSLAESFRESFENPTFILSSVVVFVCAFRFLFDGVTFGIGSFAMTVGSTDPLAYGSILTPVIAGHAYIRAKAKEIIKNKPKVDNPDT